MAHDDQPHEPSHDRVPHCPGSLLPRRCLPRSSGRQHDAAAKKGTSLVGTVSWTTTITTALDVPEGDATTGTETTSVSMNVKMSKRPAADTWQVEDNGSSYAATYTLASERKERDFFGTVDCTVTHAVNATAGGPTAEASDQHQAPAMFTEISPGTSAFSAKTKVMTLTPILRWEGTDTVTYTGSGNSPCTNAQDVDPVDGSWLDE